MARRGSRGSGAGKASSPAAAASRSKGFWKLPAVGLLILILLSWLLPSGSISSLIWGFLIALILGTVLIFGFIYTVGGKKFPSTPAGFWTALKGYKAPILWVAVIIWLFGIGGFWQLIWSPGRFVADHVAAVGDAWEGNPEQPEWLKPNGRENSFNDHNVPNWWIDFRQPSGQERIYRGGGAEGVRACETNLAAVWGDENGQGGVNDSSPVHRGGTITTLEGTPVTIPADAIVCTAGPRGSTLVLATGSVYQAYEQFRQEQERIGVACPSIPGWQCLMTQPVNPADLPNIKPRELPTLVRGECIQAEFAGNVLVFKDINVNSGPRNWVQTDEQVLAKAMGFGHYPNDAPQAVVYRFYNMTGDTCVPPN